MTREAERYPFTKIFLNPKEEKMTKTPVCAHVSGAPWGFEEEKNLMTLTDGRHRKNKPVPQALFKFYSVIFFLIHFYSRCSVAAILKLRLKIK